MSLQYLQQPEGGADPLELELQTVKADLCVSESLGQKLARV